MASSKKIYPTRFRTGTESGSSHSEFSNLMRYEIDLNGHRAVALE
jgi:hypothetical protein